jgi:hypothetical protein
MIAKGLCRLTIQNQQSKIQIRRSLTPKARYFSKALPAPEDRLSTRLDPIIISEAPMR